MVYMISQDNRAVFSRELDSMHRDRKRVFVDWLEWDVPVVDGVYEIDQYDNGNAVYIVSADPDTGRHLGSLRLMPSTRPHMLRDIFPMLCQGSVPLGNDIWEMTRLCLSPDLPREVARVNLRLTWLGTIEFCLPRGISTLTAVTHTMFTENFKASGIEFEPLGPPVEFDGKAFSAVRLPISEALHAHEKARFNRHTPVLRDCRPAVAA
jgi:N-acyl-L-homoserine lactone synthetase